MLRLLVVRRGCLGSTPLLSCASTGVDAEVVGDPVACAAASLVAAMTYLLLWRRHTDETDVLDPSHRYIVYRAPISISLISVPAVNIPSTSSALALSPGFGDKNINRYPTDHQPPYIISPAYPHEGCGTGGERTLEAFMICATLLMTAVSLPLSQSLQTQLVVHSSDAA